MTGREREAADGGATDPDDVRDDRLREAVEVSTFWTQDMIPVASVPDHREGVEVGYVWCRRGWGGGGGGELVWDDTRSASPEDSGMRAMSLALSMGLLHRRREGNRVVVEQEVGVGVVLSGEDMLRLTIKSGMVILRRGCRCNRAGVCDGGLNEAISAERHAGEQ